MVINNVYHLLLIFSGILGDLMLYKFVKEKRNRRGEVRLVSWKVPRTSSESNQDNNYKTNVPIYATLIGTLGTAFVFSNTMKKVFPTVFLYLEVHSTCPLS